MKQMIRIIRKVDLEKQYLEILKLELDYELASLHDATQKGDVVTANKIKERLVEISSEIKNLGGLA